MTAEKAYEILTEQIQDFLPEEKWNDYENALDAIWGELDGLNTRINTMLMFAERAQDELNNLLAVNK